MCELIVSDTNAVGAAAAAALAAISPVLGCASVHFLSICAYLLVTHSCSLVHWHVEARSLSLFLSDYAIFMLFAYCIS